MDLISRVERLDQDITLAINSLNSPFSDSVWSFFSDVQVWFPFYVLLLVLLFVRLGWKKALVVTLALIVTVVLCDQVANLVKDSVKRLRPIHDAYMNAGGLHRIEGRGGWYGFFSAHAANAFGVAVVASRFLKSRMPAVLFSWAFLVAISRIFVGKHYLGDVLAGALAGAAIGCAVCAVTELIINKTINKVNA